MPTLLDLAGVDPGKSGELAGRDLPGKDLSTLLQQPATASLHAVREAVLFTYSGLATNDSELIRIVSEARAAGRDPRTAVKASGYRPDMNKRGSLRTVFDGRHKLSRYFAPVERNRPRGLQELYRDNDLELFDLAQAVSDDILGVVDPLVLRHDEPAVRLACGVSSSIRLVRRHPLLARFLVRGGLPALTAGSLTTEVIPREVRAGIAAGRFTVQDERLAFDLILGAVMAALHSLLTVELPEDYPQALAQAVLQSLGMEVDDARQCAWVEFEEVQLPEGSLFTRTTAPG